MEKIVLFVSYSHQLPDHKAEVKKVIEHLESIEAFDIRHDGLANWKPTGPNEGWIEWMRTQIDQSDWIITFFSKPYLSSWKKNAQAGKGVAFEASLIKQLLYEDRMRNRKIIPAITSQKDLQFLPTEIKDFTRYHLPIDLENLKTKLYQSTWLGRFIDSVGDENVVHPPNAETVFTDVETLQTQSENNPLLKPIIDRLTTEASTHTADLASKNTALEIQTAKSNFTKSFCPLANQLIKLGGILPLSLEPFYNDSCA